MACQQHRQPAVAVRHDLNQPLDPGERVMVQVVRLVDQQHDRLLAFADQVDQLSLAQLGPANEVGQTYFAGVR